MGAADQTTYGFIRFTEPDKSLPPEARAFFAQSPTKVAKLVRVPLHDFRTSTDIARGVEGLDLQGFTYINHVFSLKDEELFHGHNAEDIYAPECIDLVLKLTGAKRAVVHNIDIRQKPGDMQPGDDLSVPLHGSAIDKEIEKFPKHELFVGGRDPGTGQEPARRAHVDLTLDGLRETLRHARQDMVDAARPMFEAEAKRQAGQHVEVTRFAAYSVWRPLSTVKRDPLGVLDWRTLDMSDITKTYLRLPSQLSETGDYILEQYTALPPKHPDAQKWYWMPEQKPNEVLIIKFCDSAAEHDERVAAACVHISPIIPGTEKEDVRRSIEARVYAFWDD